MKTLTILLLLCVVALCSAETFFEEEFKDGDGWQKRWVVSKFKPETGDLGEYVITAGKYHGDAEASKGLQTKPDARFFALSGEMKDFNNKDKPFVLQYSVKHEQNIDCGGAYVKILPAGLDQEQFHGGKDESVYNFMFGPDVCGTSKKVHFIVNYKGKNHLVKKEIPLTLDDLTHLYTLIVNNDQTYQVLVDNKEVRKGNILEDFDVLAPKEINDPAVSKPADWVEVKDIADPAAVKPEGWDAIPKQIKDEKAVKPDDWDNELDGEWEAPLIDNPEYKGEWKAPTIPNPAYKGAWVHPKIANPEYVEDKTVGLFDSHKYLGVEIWQVKSGTIFDNFLVTDDPAVAKERAEAVMKLKDEEKEMKDKATKKAEEEAKEKEAKEKGKETEKSEDNSASPPASEVHDEL